MLPRPSRRLFAVILYVFSSSVQAADVGEPTVKVDAVSARLGGELRVELTRDDRGFEKISGSTDPSATTSLSILAARLLMSGKLDPRTDYFVRFNMLAPQGQRTPVECAYGTYHLSKSFAVSMGRMKVAQGGWDQWLRDFKRLPSGAYSESLAFNEFEDMAQIQLDAGGEVRFQILNDTYAGRTDPKLDPMNEWNTGDDGEWSEGRHPTLVASWHGEFGPIKPLLDFGSYDNNKSRWIDVGIATEMNGMSASLDVYQKTVVHKSESADGETIGVSDNAAALTLYAQYESQDGATPFIYYSTFDNKQGVDQVKETGDRTVNSASSAVDDNGVDFGLGIYLNPPGTNFAPYGAWEVRSGRYAGSDGKEESKSNSWIRIGVLGSI